MIRIIATTINSSIREKPLELFLIQSSSGKTWVTTWEFLGNTRPSAGQLGSQFATSLPWNPFQLCFSFNGVKRALEPRVRYGFLHGDGVPLLSEQTDKQCYFRPARTPMNFRLATVNENSYVRANPFVFGVVPNLHDHPDFALVLASKAPPGVPPSAVHQASDRDTQSNGRSRKGERAFCEHEALHPYDLLPVKVLSRAFTVVMPTFPISKGTLEARER